jgi:uncharacterized NAD-dependent epimerase/dehydratase family protein
VSNIQTEPAIVYCEKQFGKMDGKTANGLVRFSLRYSIVGVIDGDKAGQDAGEVLDGKKNGIPIYRDLSQALEQQNVTPKYFIYGMAPLDGLLSKLEGQVIFHAMEKGMDIVNGLHEFLTDDESFVRKAQTCDVRIVDIRKPKQKKDLSLFSGRIFDVKCPKIAILGTDSAIGKRTTATMLTRALSNAGLKAIMVATGQTALIQGARYGVALDAIPEQYVSGEMEAAVVEAYELEQPDVLIIEGQGALSHPAYLSSCFIIRGSRPDAIILQHAPGREMLGDYPKLPMPSIESEIKLVESFSGSKIIGIAINHENLTDDDVSDVVGHYESKFGVAATDVLTKGSSKLVEKILSTFPELEGKIRTNFDGNAQAPN